MWERLCVCECVRACVCLHLPRMQINKVSLSNALHTAARHTSCFARGRDMLKTLLAYAEPRALAQTTRRAYGALQVRPLHSSYESLSCMPAHVAFDSAKQTEETTIWYGNHGSLWSSYAWC